MSNRTEEIAHEVQSGEWIGSIAREYDITPEMILDYGRNQELISHRDPNILFPGDIVYIPPLRDKSIDKATDQKHRFALDRFREHFEVTIKDSSGKPYDNIEYRLTIDGREFSGVTDASGKIRIEELVLSDHSSGKLELPDIYMVFPISLGLLNPLKKHDNDVTPTYDDGLSGAIMRLKNLGYFEGSVHLDDTNTDDEDIADAIRLYQFFKMKLPFEQITGLLDDKTRAFLKSDSVA
jgi:hypothetical protein